MRHYEISEFSKRINLNVRNVGARAKINFPANFINDSDYGWMGVITPPSSKFLAGFPFLNMAGLETFNERLIIPEGSFITGMSFFSMDNEGRPAVTIHEGAVIEIYEESSKRVMAGVGLGSSVVASNACGVNVIFPEFGGINVNPSSILDAPFIVFGKGAIDIRMTNLSAVDSFLQLFIQFAIPTRRAEGREMGKGGR